MIDVDPRVRRAQSLYWEIEPFRRSGRLVAVKAKLLEMANLHENRAMDLLERADPEGWTDLHAGVTAYGDAGEIGDGSRLLLLGYRLSKRFDRDRQAIVAELERTTEWLLEQVPKDDPEATDRALTRLTKAQATRARTAMVEVWERRFGRVTKAFADKLGCSASTVSGIVKGQAAPSVATVSRLAVYLGVSLHHLLNATSGLPLAPPPEKDHGGKLRQSA